MGLIENPDIFDQVNTIKKMAQKRSLIAAVLCTGGESEFFTQEMDDLEDNFSHSNNNTRKKIQGKYITSESNISHSHSPKNSAEYWQHKGIEDQDFSYSNAAEKC